jgi:hypothetical protein
MSIYSPKGIEGGILVSGSADHEIRSNGISYKKYRLALGKEEDLIENQCVKTR